MPPASCRLKLPPIVLGCVLLMRVAYAQPALDSLALEQRCMAAKTPKQCMVALPLCTQLVAAHQKEPAAAERDAALDRLWEQHGECEGQLGRYAAAEKSFRQLLVLRERRYGAEHAQVAAALTAVAEMLSGRGAYDEAEPLYRRALAIQRKLRGLEHAEVAAALDHVAGVLSDRGRFDESMSVYREALAMRRKLFGAEHREVAVSLHRVGQMLVSGGKDAEAESWHREALAMRRKLLGAEHEEVAASLHELAIAVSNQGRNVEAEAFVRQALAMRSRLFGSEHVKVAASLQTLARTLDRQGKYAEAEPLCRQALAMQRELLGPEHLQVAQSLNNLAELLIGQGKYAEAEPLCRQVVDLRRKLLGLEHVDVAQSLNNLAEVLTRQGKPAEAEPVCRQSLDLLLRRLGPEHPQVAIILSNLAIILALQGKYSETEPVRRQLVETFRRLVGPEHPQSAMATHNLSFVLGRQGKYAEAELLARSAVAVQRKILGKEHPDLALSSHNLAMMLVAQGKYEEAEPLLYEVLAMRRKLLGSEHPDVATLFNHLGLLQLDQGRRVRAVALLTEAARISEGRLRTTTSETRTLALLELLRGSEETVYSLLLDPAAAAPARKLALTLALLRKGRAAEAGAAANLLLHRNLGTPLVRRLFSQWQELRQKREALLYDRPGTLSPAAYQAELKKLRLEADSLEAQLSAGLPQLRSVVPPAFDNILAAVARRIPPGGVLVEVVWAQPWLGPVRAAKRQRGAPHFIAMLLFPDQRIVSLDLGPAAQVDAQSRQLIEKLQNPSSDPAATAQALYQTVLLPLLPHLSGRSDLYLSLDGTLNLIPFDALHDGKDYLLGRYRFHYLTSGRDLLRAATEPSTRPALVLANPDFGRVAQSAAEGRATLYQRMADLRELPGTQHEALSLQPLLGVQPLLGNAATEKAVREAQSPSILHIATHGLFLNDETLVAPRAKIMGLRSLILSGMERSKNVGAPQAERLPGEAGAMDRSALVLAGVRQGSRARNTAEDGLLTAEEARSLDLQGTQLVTLSACETGLGSLSAGQGVYGLRRAFLVAGAETLVTSLWRVHDEATGELMTLYYRKLFDKAAPGERLGALLQSMKELRGRPDGSRSHPYYWAPFLMIGQEGPLRGVFASQHQPRQ